MKTRDWMYAQARLAEIENGAPAKPPEPPAAQTPRLLKDAIADYLADCQERNLATATIVSYRNTLGHLADFFADQRLVEIDLAALTKFRTARRYTDHDGVERKVTAASSAKELQCFRALFHFSRARKWIQENPASGLKAPRPDRLPTLPFTPTEVEAILDACDRIDNPNQQEIARARLRARALVLVLLYSGFRISDAVQLRRSALDLKTGQLLVRMMKTGAPLYLRLPGVALAALHALPVESPFFFWSGTAKLSTAIGSARRTVYCLMKLASIAGGHPHRFRDTFSVELLTQGADLRTVQLLLGHTSIRTTEKHYAPYVVSMQRQLDTALSTLRFGASSLPPATPTSHAHAIVDTQQDAFGDTQVKVLPFARPKRA